MSRHKKTRHQKIIADLRRKLNLKKTESLPLGVEKLAKKEAKAESPILPKQTPIISQGEISHLDTASYLMHDLSKTAILTTAIVFFQLVFFFLLKTNVVSLPIAGF